MFSRIATYFYSINVVEKWTGPNLNSCVLLDFAIDEEESLNLVTVESFERNG